MSQLQLNKVEGANPAQKEIAQMLNGKVIVRLVSQLSFIGDVCPREDGFNENRGLTIKPSDKSNLKIWIPYDEIDNVILPNATILKGEMIKNGCGL